MNVNRYLFKINRISAWMLLVFMILFLVSGYAWVDRIIMPLAAGQVVAYSAGHLPCHLLPVARLDKHQVRLEAVEDTQ